MRPAVANLCALALGVECDEVDTLHDEAELLPALLATLILEARRAPKRDEQTEAREFFDAVHIGWGAAPFSAADLVAWADSQLTPERRRVAEAARALCRLDDGELSAQALGCRLAQLAQQPLRGQLHIVRAGARRGSALWAVRD